MLHNSVAWGIRWLIADSTNGKVEVLTLDGGGGDRVLPVFSFRDEAEMYVRLQLGTPGWEPREFSPGDLVSVLCGPLSDVARVALDPLPEACDKAVLDLLCVRRGAFVVSLVGKGKSEVSGEHPGQPETLSRRPRSTVAPRVAVRGAVTDPPSMWAGPYR